MRITLKKRTGREKFSEPRTNCSIYPLQCCPAFTPRKGAFPTERECWFCKYADFHIEKQKTLEVGICGYPNENKNIIKG